MFHRLLLVTPMPTVYRYKGFRLHFYSNEGHEPPHIHIRRGEDTCKFWLRPVSLAYNDGMNPRELKELAKLVGERRAELERKWIEYFT